MTNQELIQKAASAFNPTEIGNSSFGTVSCALETEKGTIFTGVCIDTSSSLGFCAEHAAIATMITAKEYRINKIVAVKVDEQGNTFVLSPCGRCREFIRQVNPDNLQSEVILGKDKSAKLEELLPYHSSKELV